MLICYIVYYCNINLKLIQCVVMLNQSGEEPIECPLCMESLEVDDISFFPCTCGYQICRFCWHRIRTDENGLCPACRKPYSENPADFRPLSREEVAHLKAQKKQKIQKRKQKITENRKHLANIRVVQRNLVFVVGLPTRLADAEVLKKHEYFGKFGKIQKVVLNQSTSYAGSQGPSASAYVTYHKADDALRAIQAVNNIRMDARCIRSSLGTTKYCSHFLKNQMCPKPECMYLHELGDAEASFTKEDVQQGKHREYEKKLHEQLLNAGKDTRKSVPYVVVPSTINNYQNMNTTTRNMKEVHADSRGTEYFEEGSGFCEESPTENSDLNNFAGSRSGDCKGGHINQKTKICQVNNIDTLYTSDKETQRKKDCEVQDESESKEMCPVQGARLNVKVDSDKFNSNEYVSKSNNDSLTQILESESNPRDGVNISANVDSNEVEQLEGERRCLLPVQSSVTNSSSTESLNAQEAVNMQDILPSEKQRSIFHFPALSSSINVQVWNCNPRFSLSDTSQLHSFNYDKNSCDTDFKDVKIHNENSSYLINKFHTSATTSEVVAGTDRQINRLEDSATVTDSCVQNSAISNMSNTPPILHYDPATLMVNQLSGGNSGSQFLFMNGQPSEVTKRFLEDVQKARQHNCLELGATRKLVLNSKLNGMLCNTEMVNERDVRVNGYQNDSDKLSRVQEQPSGFLYHQNKNKHANIKYINSVINPVMSAVQITNNKRTSEDELGFDPFHETQKALAEMMERENKTQNNTTHHSSEHFNHHSVDSFNSHQKSILPQQKNSYRPPPNVTECEHFLNGLGLCRRMSRARLPPPGFTAPCHITVPHSSSDANVQSECFRRKHESPFKK